MLDGLGGEREPRGDLGVAEVGGDEADDLDFALGQAGGVGAGGGSGAARDGACAALAQASRDELRHRSRAQLLEDGECPAQGRLVVALGRARAAS